MISIIGAGPSGTSTARELAKHFDVTIYEKKPHHRKTCSCILTHEIENIEKIPKKLIKTKVKTARIHAPNNKFLEINFKKPDLIYNREELNEYFCNKAVDAGAKLLMNRQFTGLNGNIVIIKDIKSKKIEHLSVKYLIGADGALSNVAKQAGIFENKNNKRRFFTGLKAEIRKKNDNIINFYPYIKDFSWQSPIDDETIEVGVCSEKNPKIAFQHLLKKFPGKIIKKEAALIPIWNTKQQLQKNNVLLVGDAGTINKATTGGGIIFGIISGRIAAEEIINAEIKRKKLNYERAVRKKIGNNLWMHLQMRKILNKFSEKDWNELIEKFQNPKLKKILSRESRDYPLKFAGNLFMNDITLLKYSTKIF